MARTKTKPASQSTIKHSAMNGTVGEVLTLGDAAGYLRLTEPDVLRLIHEQNLPARELGGEWRILKTALQQWLSEPHPKPEKDFWEACFGVFKDDPHLQEMVDEAYRRRRSGNGDE
jgi:excisionase family DNA binding protein